MKIGHCQLESLSGDFEANLDREGRNPLDD